MEAIDSKTEQKATKNCYVGNNASSRFGPNLEVGRIAITCPCYGRLDVYMKRDQRLGAVFISMEDAGRYGTTQGVRERFPEPGSYNGWGYINTDQTVIFRFMLCDASNMPGSLVQIQTPDGRVDFPASIRKKTEYADGAIVAFYARLVRKKGADQPRRQATDVFLVDADHLPLAARLISDGRLTFPDHNEVLQLFFDSLPGVQTPHRRNLGLFDSALAYLAADSSVPAQFQTLARVERSKLLSVANSRMVPVRIPRQASKKRYGQKTKADNPKVEHPSKEGVVADVMRVNLQIGKD